MARPRSRTLAQIEAPVVIEALPEPDEYGPAMQALDARQRAFVILTLQLGDDNRSKAAKLAGYGGPNATDNSMFVAGHRLSHNPKIKAAIAEEAHRRLDANSYMAVGVVAEIMMDKKVAAKDRLKAAEIVLNRTGFHARTEVVHKVEELPIDAKVKKLIAFAKESNLDARAILAGIGIDYTEFEEIDVG